MPLHFRSRPWDLQGVTKGGERLYLNWLFRQALSRAREDLHEVTELVLNLGGVRDGVRNFGFDQFTESSSQSMNRDFYGPFGEAKPAGRVGL